jgi:hypothetical protein
MSGPPHACFSVTSTSTVTTAGKHWTLVLRPQGGARTGAGQGHHAVTLRKNVRLRRVGVQQLVPLAHVPGRRPRRCECHGGFNTACRGSAYLGCPAFQARVQLQSHDMIRQPPGTSASGCMSGQQTRQRPQSVQLSAAGTSPDCLADSVLFSPVQHGVRQPAARLAVGAARQLGEVLDVELAAVARLLHYGAVHRRHPWLQNSQSRLPGLPDMLC